MITLMFAAYAAACVLIFKVFRLRMSTWNVSTTVLGGIVGVGGVLIAMNYNQPFTADARILFYTTPIFSTVTGRVIDVPIKPNMPLKKGDVLFRLDPAPFEDVVNQRKAQLAQAEQNVKELKAALNVAQAKVEEAEASRDRAQQAYDRYAVANQDARHAGRAPPFSARDEANRKGQADEATAAWVAAVADANRARLAYNSTINGVNTDVAGIKAQLEHAEFELSQATVRAPTDGYATQLFLRPGMVAMPMPIRPIMVFVHGDENVLAAAFAQNVTQRVRAGQEAEVAFQGVPGQVFRGRVSRIVSTVAQGQLQPSGDLLLPEQKGQAPGEITAVIDLIDDISIYQIPAGSTAQVAVYTDHWRHLIVVRQILLRMKSWLNYLTFPN